MKKTKLIIMLFPVLLFSSWKVAFAALTVDVDFTPAPVPAGFEAFVEQELHDQLDKYSNMTDFSRGFGNANTYAASNGVTMRGYQGYDLICIAVGTMWTIQAPNSDPLFFQNIQKELDNGDVYTGLGANPIAGQVGLNMSFVIPDLYVAFRFGKLNRYIDKGSYSFDYNTNLIGVIIDYQIIPSKSILAGLLMWKGLNIESGFIYSTNKAVYYKDLELITISDAAYPGWVANIDPDMNLEMKIKNYIIPLELYAGFRIFYMINFGAGIGMDYVYKSDVELDIISSGSLELTDGATTYPGTLELRYDPIKNQADRYRPKLMVNFGVGFGPVFVDIPLTFYVDNGYAVGLSAGIVW